MADFTALKATIQQYIKQNGNNEITGVLLQDILLSMVSTLGESAINDLTQALADEVTARGGADTLLSGRIDTLSGSQTALATFINSGYIFKGIATLSTNPGTINGKVFYLTVTAGQYANMGNVTANAGISVLAYDGSAWSATLLLGMDNTPVENSGNMVKSGGVHFAIAAETARALAAETSSVEFNSTTKNLIFKNSEGTVLYQLAVSTFLNSGAVYAGYATPSTNPPALTGQKVFYVATQAGTYTHFLANYDTPIILANDGIYFLVSGVDDDDWNAEIIMGVDDEPTAGSNNLVKSGGVQNELALGAVYDVSAKNPTAGPNNDGKWESLSALLSDANLNNLIPTSVRKGGMSIKFVQSSDNKYVRCNLLADSFTTDTTQWAIDDVGVYVENPEFVYVKTDKEGRILWAIKKDGSIYWGAGVPQQVIDYVQEKIDELSLDEYEDIVSFLGTLIDGNKTLQDLLDEIAEVVPELAKEPAWLEVTTDKDGKILEGIDTKGRKVVETDFIATNSTSTDSSVKETLKIGVSNLINLDFVGNNNNYVRKYVHLEAGHKYRIHIPAMWQSPVDNSTAIFSIDKSVDGISHSLVFVIRGMDVLTINHYDFIADEAEHYRINLKAVSDVNVHFSLEDITDVCFVNEFIKRGSYEIDTDLRGTVINNTPTITSNSSPFIEMEDVKGMCYVVSMGSDHKYGEAGDVLILTAFPSLQPWKQEYYEVGKPHDTDFDGDDIAGTYEHYTVSFYNGNDEFIVRTIFTDNPGENIWYRDFNTHTKAFESAAKKVKYYTDNNELRVLKGSEIAAWVASKGGSWEGVDQMMCLSNKIQNDTSIWDDGEYIYSSLTAFKNGGGGNPVIIKSDDNFATVHLVAMLPYSDVTEIAFTKLGNRYYILYRGDGILFNTTEDFVNFTTIKRITGSQSQKPVALTHKDKVYLFVPTSDYADSIMGGRSAYHVYQGTDTDFSKFTDELWLKNKFGLVYMNSMFFNGRLVLVYSTNQMMLANNKSGKSTVIFQVVENYYK